METRDDSVRPKFGGGALLLSAAALAFGALSPVSVSAQESNLEEIIVTAQRRDQNLQSVPIAVTTVTAASLAKSGITSSDFLSVASPGVNINGQQRSAMIFIRGVGSTTTSAGQESAVSTYVDGVYMSAPSGNIFSLNNIERVEVLKGPQGTLYGRNATGGLVHVYTRNPSQVPGFVGNISYGNYQTVEGSIYATGGLTDTLAANISLAAADQEKGFGRSVLTGAEVNRKWERSARAKLMWTPSDADTFILAGDYSHTRTDLGIIRNAWPGSIQAGGVPRRGGDYDYMGDASTNPPNYKAGGVSLNYKRALGWANLNLLSGYRYARTHNHFDGDTTPAPTQTTFINERTLTWQNEAVLNGDVGRLNWTAGVFAFRSRANYDPLTFTGAAPAANMDRIVSHDANSYSGFVDLTYALTDQLSVTGGLRMTHDKRTFATEDRARVGNTLPVGTLIRSGAGSKSWSEPTWRLVVDYKFTPQVMVYGSYSRGFKAGLYNPASPFGPPVDPETIDAYELGLKSQLLDNTVRFNAAVYHYDYKDIQLSRNNGTVLILQNAAGAKIDGGEVEVIYAPRLDTGHLELTASMAYTDAKFSSFPGMPIAQPRPPAQGGNVTVFGDGRGNRVPKTPKFTSTVSAFYRVPIGEGEGSINVTWYYNDGFFIEADNRLKQVSYNLFNADVGYSFGENNRYRVSVFGRNLTNERYVLYASEGANGDVVGYQPPRTYGVALRVTLGE